MVSVLIYNVMQTIMKFVSTYFLFIIFFMISCNDEYPYSEITETEMPLRQIVGKNYGTQNFFVGMVPHGSEFFNPTDNSYRLLFSKEFGVLSIDTAFFQDNLLKGPREQYSDILYRPFFVSARQYGMYLYSKAGLSNHTSEWMKDNTNSMNNPSNIEMMITKIFSNLSSDLAANIDVAKWIEVVKDPFPIVNSNEYFETNPWNKLGNSEIFYIDGNQQVFIPKYIVLALENVNKNAPNIKKIISQGGELNIEVWEKMKKMITALREAGIKVDGIAWNATFEDDDSGIGFKWTHPGKRIENEKLLGELIDWCSRNRFEFHLTSIELEMRNFDAVFGLTNEFAVEVTRDAQIEVLKSIMSVLLPRVGRGISTIQFNGLTDIIPESGETGIKPRLFDIYREQTVLYNEFRKLISN